LVDLRDVTLSDLMPVGVLYIRNTTVPANGRQIDEPDIGTEGDRQTLDWYIGDMPRGSSVTLRFNSITTPRIADRIVNQVTAVGYAGPPAEELAAQQSTAQPKVRKIVRGIVVVASNVALAVVKKVGGVFTERALIAGRVYLDRDHDKAFTAGSDAPLANARVYLSDGRFSLTDAQGRYSFPDVDTGTHTLRLDPLTAPFQAKVVRSDFGLDGSRLVRIDGPGIFNQDFPLVAPEVEATRVTSTSIARGPVTLTSRLDVTAEGYAVTLTIKLSTAVEELSLARVVPPAAAASARLDGMVNGAVVSADGSLKVGGRLDAGTWLLTYTVTGAGVPPGYTVDPVIEWEEVTP
ncbi:MAG TPA: carboxypeptidase-like regulatory domain-containing protein, partial [Deinococcales bacterium]|nr:carboxypeptidase-like regulatory domain-containing protein [Deinococcales bacterium]